METYKYVMTFDTPSIEDGYYSRGIRKITGDNDFARDSMESRWIGNIDTLIEERREMVNVMSNAGVPLIVLPHPLKSAKRNLGIKESIEYIRDPIVSSPMGRVMVFNMASQIRKMEKAFQMQILSILGVDHVESIRGVNEGGNSRIIHLEDESWMFAATSSRSDKDGLHDESEFLQIAQCRQLIMEIIEGKGFHFDCVFMVAVDEDGTFHIATYMDAFSQESRKNIGSFLGEHNAQFYELTTEDVRNMASNQLFAGGHIFRTGKYSDEDVEEKWSSMPGVRVHTFPLTQNLNTGGQVHCLTQELYLPSRVDEGSLRNKFARYSDIFGDSPKLQIFNNY